MIKKKIIASWITIALLATTFQVWAEFIPSTDGDWNAIIVTPTTIVPVSNWTISEHVIDDWNTSAKVPYAPELSLIEPNVEPAPTANFKTPPKKIKPFEEKVLEEQPQVVPSIPSTSLPLNNGTSKSEKSTVVENPTIWWDYDRMKSAQLSSLMKQAFKASYEKSYVEFKSKFNQDLLKWDISRLESIKRSFISKVSSLSRSLSTSDKIEVLRVKAQIKAINDLISNMKGSSNPSSSEWTIYTGWTPNFDERTGKYTDSTNKVKYELIAKKTSLDELNKEFSKKYSALKEAYAKSQGADREEIAKKINEAKNVYYKNKKELIEKDKNISQEKFSKVKYELIAKKTSLDELNKEFAENYTELRKKYADKDITAEEKSNIRKELTQLRVEYENAKQKLYKTSIDAKKDFVSNSKIDRNEVKTKFKKIFKTQFEKKLQAMSKEKLTIINKTIDNIISKFENNSKISEDRKETKLWQLYALKSLITDIIDTKDTNPDLNKVFELINK